MKRKTFWYLIEDLPEYPAQSLRVAVEMDRFPKQYGYVNAGTFFMHYKNGAGPLYCKREGWDRAVRVLLEFLEKNPQWYDQGHSRIKHYVRILEKLCPKIEKMDIKTLSIRKLAGLYDKLENAATMMHLQRGPGWFMEQRNEDFSRLLFKRLSAHIQQSNLKVDPVYTLAILITSLKRVKTYEEEVAFLKLAQYRRGMLPKQALTQHLKKYWYLTYGVTGPGMNLDELKEHFVALQSKNPKAQLKKLDNQHRVLVRQQHELLKQLKLPRKLYDLIMVGQMIGFEKAWTKELQFYSYAIRDKMSREISRRFSLSLRQALWMTPFEIRNMLRQGNMPNQSELNLRFKESGLFMDRRGMRFIFGKNLTQFLRSNRLEKPPTPPSSARKVQGSPAVPGCARGVVRIINTPDQMGKMQKGNVLVSVMTIPEIVPAMKKASAIVTDVGGITCHAAIVSREMRIPCVIGTKFATKVFKDGDRVEVDAERGIVRKLS